jgi:hypothetical protein
MEELGVGSGSTFEGWLVEEKAYLQSLASEPVEDTLQMEYCQKLIELNKIEYVPLILFLFFFFPH